MQKQLMFRYNSRYYTIINGELVNLIIANEVQHDLFIASLAKNLKKPFLSRIFNKKIF